ncbi:hypothetical protein [Kushneria konosiri]|uniref:Uncharacterized protein n=1 Tax=Kushneria konosiri TaxID=698828 RepID=A0A2Z2H9V4_9GAMM|nr:hypothetical protein [Kushneria konosiri]ARS51817.1 hypothetical protein B9G99_01990 [Kushneria konosiri]
MRHHRHYPLIDIAILLTVILLALFVLMRGDALVPERGNQMPAWCDHHDGHCPDVSSDPVRSFDG